MGGEVNKCRAGSEVLQNILADTSDDMYLIDSIHELRIVFKNMVISVRQTWQ